MVRKYRSPDRPGRRLCSSDRSRLASCTHTFGQNTTFSTMRNGGPKAAVTVDKVVADYAFLRLAKPINPIKPDPNSHRAAGTGTVATSANTTDPLGLGLTDWMVISGAPEASAPIYVICSPKPTAENPPVSICQKTPIVSGGLARPCP